MNGRAKKATEGVGSIPVSFREHSTSSISLNLTLYRGATTKRDDGLGYAWSNILAIPRKV